MDYWWEQEKNLTQEKTEFVHCQGGYRSMTFVSLFRARGYTNLVNVRGGFAAIKASNKFQLTDYVCPTTML